MSLVSLFSSRETSRSVLSSFLCLMLAKSDVKSRSNPVLD